MKKILRILLLFLLIQLLILYLGQVIIADETYTNDFSSCQKTGEHNYFQLLKIDTKAFDLQILYEPKNSTIVIIQKGVVVEKIFFDNKTSYPVYIRKSSCPNEYFNGTILYASLPEISKLKKIVLLTSIGDITLDINSISNILEKTPLLPQSLRNNELISENNKSNTTNNTTINHANKTAVREGEAGIQTSIPQSNTYTGKNIKIDYKDLIPLMIGFITFLTSYILLKKG